MRGFSGNRKKEANDGDVVTLVPLTVKNFAIEHAEKRIDPPCRQEFETAALFADVSGFTKMSEALAKKHGPRGAEDLSFYLNRYIERLAKLIARSGGDVMKFAGDAMLVIWPPTPGAENDRDEHVKMVHRAAQCSRDIQDELSECELTAGVTLNVKIGVGFGKAVVIHVGGVYNRLECLAMGEPLMQAFQCEGHASSGDSIISPQAWALVKDSFEGEEVGEGCVKILKVLDRVKNVSVNASKRAFADIPIGAVKHLQRYVPKAIIPFLQLERKVWCGDLRHVTVMFVSIGIDLSKANYDLSKLQKVIVGIQKSVYTYEGSLNKFLVDDKGSTLIAVFGLTPVAHEDDAERAVLSALYLHKKMSDVDIQCSIGVTTGLVYCGLVGAGSSREYGILGDLVNLSARLMQASKKGGHHAVLCNDSTVQNIDRDCNIRFLQLDKIKVKGKSVKIQIYAPAYVDEVPEPFQPKRNDASFGIDENLKQFKAAVQLFEQNGRGFVNVVEGETGSGKSHMLRAMTEVCEESTDDVVTAWSVGPRHNKKQLIGWQQIFINLFEFYLPKEKRKRAQVEHLLEDRSDLTPHFYLLNDLLNLHYQLPVDADPNSEDSEKKLFTMVIELLSVIADKNSVKLLLVFDSTQNLCGKDWKILKFVSQKILSKSLPNVSMVIASRPVLQHIHSPRFGPPNTRYQAIRNHPCRTLTCMQPWSKEDLRLYMLNYFYAHDVHPFIVSYGYELTGGNPYFSEKLCEILDVDLVLENSMLKIVMSPSFVARSNVGSLVRVSVPLRVQGIIMSYIDRLNLRQIIILKLAAAQAVGMGRGVLEFSADLIIEAHPIANFMDYLREDLEHLEGIGLIVPFDSETRDSHCFTDYQHLHEATYLCDYIEFLRPNVDDDWTHCIGKFLDGKISLVKDDRDADIIHELEIDPKSNLILEDDEMTLTVAKKSIKLRAPQDTLDTWSTTINEAIKGSANGANNQKLRQQQNEEDLPQHYAFRDGFIRDTLYETMLYKQRQLIHNEYEKIYENLTDNGLFFQDCVKRHRAFAKQNQETTEVEVKMSPRSPRVRVKSSQIQNPRTSRLASFDPLSSGTFEPKPPEKKESSRPPIMGKIEEEI